ncbi:hypothetical protein EB796_005152 [Bugula neritina]|uniref:Uncharacterized protein n=1 Tax=Bugula neritina TaxID=10212 RepID=A0A7J7KD15_BUGNE|nr:hypothetical protein EB796_005152 [Bugula neritina]
MSVPPLVPPKKLKKPPARDPLPLHNNEEVVAQAANQVTVTMSSTSEENMTHSMVDSITSGPSHQSAGVSGGETADLMTTSLPSLPSQLTPKPTPKPRPSVRRLAPTPSVRRMAPAPVPRPREPLQTSPPDQTVSADDNLVESPPQDSVGANPSSCPTF